jgi:fermentation-respiration switch protein FrsA (DUF1100 family)
MSKNHAWRWWLALFWLSPHPTEPASWRYQATRILVLLGYVYVGLGIALVAMETELVFRPKKHPEFWDDAPASANVVDLTLVQDGLTVHGWWLEPSDWTPERGALLHCHGHGCNLSHLPATALRWRDTLGRAVLMFDYPGFGKSAGEPTEAGCYESARAAFDWLKREKKVEDIVVYGHSLGGAVAIDLATRRPVRAVLVTSSFTSMPDAARVLVPMYPTGWLMRARFNSAQKLAKCTAPVFIAHGTADQRVPFEQGEMLAKSCGTPTFLAIQGAGHNLEGDPRVLEAASAFLERIRPR